MFLFKKIVGSFFQPIPLCLSLLLLGLFFLIFIRKKKTGKVLVGIGALILAIFSYGGVSDMLLNPLEGKYPAISAFEELKGTKWIVVLSGGCGVDPDLPLSTYLSESSLARLSEGVYIHNKLPETKLILTGRSGFEGITPVAEVMEAVAVEWGVGPEDIVLEIKATDTKDHPIYVKEIVGKDRFILVTSASHMPRAMAFFRKHGMEPIPAPTDYMVKQFEDSISVLPSVSNLKKSDTAFYEILGIIKEKALGRIPYGNG